MRYICEFASEDDEIMIRDLADDIEELEDCVYSGIEHLGPLMRCYPLEDDESIPTLGLVKRDAATRAHNA